MQIWGSYKNTGSESLETENKLQILTNRSELLVEINRKIQGNSQ